MSTSDVSMLQCAVLFLFIAPARMTPSEPEVLDLDKNTQVIPVSSDPLSRRLGVNIHSLNDDAALDAAQSAGFSFVRMDLTWATIEKSGEYDFSGYDRLLASLEARGMGVLWIIDYGHPEHGGAQPRSSADVAAFGRYAEAAAAHFRGRKIRYEVWNEPNLSKFLPDPGIYPQLLEQAITAIRRGDPSALVSTGGLSGFDYDFFRKMMPREAAEKADAIAVHPYRAEAPETAAPDFSELAEQVHAQFRRNIPIWDTEWGYSSAGFQSEAVYGDGHSEAARKRQAVFAARQLLTVWMLNLPVVVWYDLRDDGSDAKNPEANFGLLDQAGKDKIAMRAVRTLMAAAKSRLAGIVAHSSPRVRAIKLENDASFTFIVWRDHPGFASLIRVPEQDLISATNMTGAEIRPIIENGKATITIDEPDGPVYLHLRRP